MENLCTREECIPLKRSERRSVRKLIICVGGSVWVVVVVVGRLSFVLFREAFVPRMVPRKKKIVYCNPFFAGQKKTQQREEKPFSIFTFSVLHVMYTLGSGVM